MDFQQNFMNSLIGGLQFGQQLKAQRDTSQINQLAGQAYSAAPEQRDSALAQMYQINPTMAAEQEKAIGISDESRQKGLINAARILVNTPEQFRAGQYARMVPGLSRYGLSSLPPEYNAETSGLIMETAQGLVRAADASGSGGTLQSQKIGDDGFIYNTFRDGRMVNTGVRADRQMWLRDHPGMAAPELVGKDGSLQVVGQSAQGSPQPAGPKRMDMEADIELANAMIAAGIPEAQVDAFLAQRGQRAAAGAAQVTAAPAQAFARPSAAQDAAATERAKLQAQAEYLPQELAMRGQAAVDQAVGIERGKAGIESQSTARAKSASLNNVDRGLERIEKAMAALSGRFMDTGPVDGRIMIATEAGQELDRAVGTIQNDMLALTRVPGIGSQSDLETKIANLKYPSIYNHPEVNRRNLEQLRAFMGDLRSQIQGSQAVGQQPQQGAPPRQSTQQRPVMVNSPAEYNALPAGALYTAPDGSTRRKK